MSRSGFYTGKGDRGETLRLAGKNRIPKDSELIEAIGALDEAVSAIGMARALAGSAPLKPMMATVQRHIYRLLSHLSAVPDARERYPGLSQVEVAWLEARIAELEPHLPSLDDFVLPGETSGGAAFHVARTVVRRAERRLVALVDLEPKLGEANLAYVNRLSSLMFVAALAEDTLDGRSPTLAREASDM
ncbi:MAG: cob(I)yrinic acid a,c-diamide adenosyltransferase [Anaerolineae bacterium]